MKCDEFKNELNRQESSDFSIKILEHAKTCKGCLELMKAQEGVEKSLVVIGNCTPKSGLTLKIMQKVKLEKAESGRSVGIFETIAQAFSNFRFQTAFVFSMCLFLAVYISFRNKPVEKIGEPTRKTWEMAFVAGQPGSLPKGAVEIGNVWHLADGEPVNIGKENKGLLKIPGRAEVQLENGVVIPLKTGFFLKNGNAEVKVTKNFERSPFTIETPFGEVVVVGTQFVVQVTTDQLHVSVKEGRVRVTNKSAQKELTRNEEIWVGDGGFKGEVASISFNVNQIATQASTEVENPGK